MAKPKNGFRAKKKISKKTAKKRLSLFWSFCTEKFFFLLFRPKSILNAFQPKKMSLGRFWADLKKKVLPLSFSRKKKSEKRQRSFFDIVIFFQNFEKKSEELKKKKFSKNFFEKFFGSFRPFKTFVEKFFFYLCRFPENSKFRVCPAQGYQI